MPISEGSLYNFIKTSYEQLLKLNVLERIKAELIQEKSLHADETGININGKRQWLHCASSSRWTHLAHHTKRGKEAMDEVGILPAYKGVLCHDHWKAYYRYDCSHALCNAHLLRELIRAHEQDNQNWAKKMHTFLLELNLKVDDSGGILCREEQKRYTERYQAILKGGEKESPLPPKIPGKRGRVKKTKSRNLLERFQAYENEVLRFMTDKAVPFTNNQGERDLRMLKVQQKISGCFRSETGAAMFCALRSYLSSCKKQEICAITALSLLFSGILPDIFTKGAE